LTIRGRSIRDFSDINGSNPLHSTKGIVCKYGMKFFDILKESD
jgi:hypothetical protein